MATEGRHVRLIGLAQAKAAFQALPAFTRVRLLAAGQRSGFRLTQRARPLVPVRFGYLRDALAVKAFPASGVVIVGIARRRYVRPGIYASGRRKGQQRDAILTTRYAHLAHDGTSRVRGVPFMLTAARAEQAEFRNEAIDAFRAAVADTVSTVGGRFL